MTGEREGGHFLSFVKCRRKLWELEESRMRPLEKGTLDEMEDVLSPRALEMGIKRTIGLHRDGEGRKIFSCIVLARKI
jgi:ubiquitin carboxyl-terminal hydrolase L3